MTNDSVWKLTHYYPYKNKLKELRINIKMNSIIFTFILLFGLASCDDINTLGNYYYSYYYYYYYYYYYILIF